MKKDKKEIITEEGFPLKFYQRETIEITLEISSDTLEALEKKAAEREMPLKALLKFYIGLGLREDLSEEEARELALKKIKSRKDAPQQSSENDLAA